jgi:hypothetical protein
MQCEIHGMNLKEKKANSAIFLPTAGGAAVAGLQIPWIRAMDGAHSPPYEGVRRDVQEESGVYSAPLSFRIARRSQARA